VYITKRIHTRGVLAARTVCCATVVAESKSDGVGGREWFLQEDWLNKRISIFHWLQAIMRDSCRKHGHIGWHLVVWLDGTPVASQR
jgi:hypothetical protein